jgi:hypothetical protein
LSKFRRLTSRNPVAQSFIVALVGVVAGLASIAVGLLSSQPGDRILLLAVIVFAVTAVVMVPIVVAPAQALGDFLRIASIDARLLGGIDWHPDIGLSGVKVPDRIFEGRSDQEVLVRLLYKPIVSAHRGSVRGTLRLKFDPPLVEFDDIPFELSEDIPVREFRFDVPFGAFNTGPLLGRPYHHDQKNRVPCSVLLTVSSPWDLRLFEHPRDRAVTLNVGSTEAQSLDAQDWTRRMIDNGFLGALPNDGVFNPVIPARFDCETGTNLAIATGLWQSAVADGDFNAHFLAVVGARLAAAQLRRLEPFEFVPVDDAPDARQYGSPGSALYCAINPPDFITYLQALIRDELERIHLSESDRREVRYPLPLRSRRVVSLFVQDLTGFLTDPSAGMETFSLFGFERLPESGCVVAVQSASLPTTVAADIGSVLSNADAELMYRRDPSVTLPDAIDEPSIQRRISTTESKSPRVDSDFIDSGEDVAASPSEHANGSGTDGVEPLLPIVQRGGVVALRAVVEEIAASVGRSGSVTHGLYAQPTPSRDSQWIDLRLLSGWLRREHLDSTLASALDSVMSLIAGMSKPERLVVYNVCNPTTRTADRRFEALHHWTPEQFPVLPAVYGGSSWQFADCVGDVCIISAVANDWSKYEGLGRLLARNGRAVTFVPVFGPMRRISHGWHEDEAPVDWNVMPLLSWSDHKGAFVSSLGTERYRSTWTLVDRLSG